MILDEIPAVFCARLKRLGYESIWDSGEVMRREKRSWLIHSSANCWRWYESVVARLWSFWQTWC